MTDEAKPKPSRRIARWASWGRQNLLALLLSLLIVLQFLTWLEIHNLEFPRPCRWGCGVEIENINDLANRIGEQVARHLRR